MAEASISWAEDQFSCPVCLDLLKDPVTIPCGHSYCKRCISGCWDQEDWKGIYSCPQCRKTFSPRPVLGKNVVFAEMVEKLKKTRLQSAAPAVHHAGPGDVQCDSCTGIKQKAVKSCLECRSSYCQTHLEQHENLFRHKKHNLMDATGRLQEMICPQHGKMLEIYCRTDQRCICTMCLVDEHKNHDTVSTAAARTEKQIHLEKKQRNIQKRIQQKEKDLQELREAVESHKHSAQTAVEDSERIFTELIRSIEKRRSEVKQLIRDQERAAVSRAEEQLEQLKLELHDLRCRDVEIKHLSETQDHVHFLQSLSSVSLSGSTDGFTVSSHLTFDDVVKSVSQLRDKLQQFCRQEIKKISKKVKTVHVIQTPEYQTPKEFLQYSHPVAFPAEQPSFSPHLQLTPLSMFKAERPKPPVPNRTQTFKAERPKPPVPNRTHTFKAERPKPPVPNRTHTFKAERPKPPVPNRTHTFKAERPKPPVPNRTHTFKAERPKPPVPNRTHTFKAERPKPPVPNRTHTFKAERPKPPVPNCTHMFTGEGPNLPVPTLISIFEAGGPNSQPPPTL